MTASSIGVRPTHASDTALRLCIVGASGQLDFAVPGAMSVRDLAAAYAEELGDAPSGVPVLVAADGRPLPAEARVGDVARHGDVLAAVVDTARAAAPRTEPSAGVPDRTAGSPLLGLLRLAGAGACAAAAAALLAVAPAEPSRAGLFRATTVESAALTQPLVAALLLLGALVAVLLAPRITEPLSTGAHLLAPAVAAAGGFALAWSTAPGGPVLAVAAAGLMAMVAGALTRTRLDEQREDLARVWLTTGTLLAVIGVLCLVAGVGPLGLSALALVVAVTVMGMLPALVVDVDDDVLLDLDRLAVTAWSARERPRGGRKRHQVRMPLVRHVARRSTRTVAAGATLCSVAAVIAAPVVLTGGDSDRTAWSHWSGIVMVGLGGAVLGLVARGFRSLYLRAVVGVSAVWLVALPTVLVLADLGATTRWYAFAAAVVIAPLVLVAAVSLGHGWRSVWWARVAEILETLCGVVLVALLPVASGLFDVVRLTVAT